MTNRKIDYNEKANRLFNWFEEKKFEREMIYASRDFEIACSFCDWIDDMDIEELAQISGLYDDISNEKKAEKEAKKLYKFIKKGMDKYLNEPFEMLLKNIGAEKC